VLQYFGPQTLLGSVLIAEKSLGEMLEFLSGAIEQAESEDVGLFTTDIFEACSRAKTDCRAGQRVSKSVAEDDQRRH